MAGILGKIEKLVDTATTVNSIYTKLNSSGLLSGINLNNIDIKNLGGIGSTIQNNIQKQTSDITNSISSSINIGEIENFTKSLTPEELGVEMPDMSSITSQIESEMSSIPNISGAEFDFGNIDLSGLENISLM